MKKYISFILVVIIILSLLSGCSEKSDPTNESTTVNSDIVSNNTDFSPDSHTYLMTDNEYVRLELIAYVDSSTNLKRVAVKATRKAEKIAEIYLSDYVINGSFRLSDNSTGTDSIKFEDSDDVYKECSALIELFSMVASDKGWDELTKFTCHVNACGTDAITHNDESSIWYGDVTVDSKTGFNFGMVVFPYLGAMATRQYLGTVDGIEFTLISLGWFDFYKGWSDSSNLNGLIYASNTSDYDSEFRINEVQINGMTFNAYSQKEEIKAGRSAYTSFYVKGKDSLSGNGIMDYFDGIESVTLFITGKTGDFESLTGGEAFSVELSETGTNTMEIDKGTTILEDEYVRVGFVKQLSEEDIHCAIISIENKTDTTITIDLMELSSDGTPKVNDNFSLSFCDTVSPNSVVFANVYHSGVYINADNEEYVKGQYEGTFVLHIVAGNYTYNTESFTMVL